MDNDKNKKEELQFLKEALINLELAQTAQEDQKHFGWVKFTSDTVRELKIRIEGLEFILSKSG